MIMKLKPASVSLDVLLKYRLLDPLPGRPPQSSRKRTLKTAGLERVGEGGISLLLGHFNHPGTSSGPFVQRALSAFGVSAAPPH